MERRINYILFIDYFLFLLVRVIEVVFSRLPEKMALSLGRFLGRLAYILFPDRRRAVLENLTIAFGLECSRVWIVRTARKSFEHLGLLTVEFFRIRRWTQQEMAERIIIEGKLPFNLTMLPGYHGICLLNSHFGCFEVSAATVKFLAMRTNLIVTGLKNPFLTRYFFNRGGRGDEETGIKTFPDKGMAKEMIRFLRAGEMLAYLADQRGDAERGIFVNFFGAPAPANEIFARLAIDGEARVLPLCTYRLDDGRYRSIFGEEIRLQLTGDQHKDLTTVSQQFHNIFEEWLRLKPEQGFWLQRKWRRKPSRRRPVKTSAESSQGLNPEVKH